MSAPAPAGAPPPAPPSGSAPPPVAAAAPAPSPPTTVTPAPSSVPPPASSSPPSLPSSPPTATESPPSAPSQSPGASTASPPSSPASGSSSPPPPHGSATKNLSPPPPSKHGGRSPPPPHRSSSPPSSHSSGGGGVSTALVIGIAAAGVIAVIVIVTVAICCRKRKRRGYVPGQYHVDPPHPYKEDYYGGPLQHWQQNAPPPMDHIKKIPPPLPPAPPPAMSIRPSSSPAVFPPPPPPPPPLVGTSSGENSSSGFSRSHHPLPPPSPGLSLGFSKSMFTYEDLEAATGGFSGANLLGQGGFGCVYKGILPDGQLIAVKQLKVGGGQGEREFQAEVEIISRVHHRHLVSLVGYCITGLQRILAYEFVSNNTLEYHLHGKGRPSMDWPTRLKIALGAARGLAYLHEDCYPRIIHRDIKSSNILLDDNFEAKVSDFGLAKLASDGFTHVSTRVMGTFGYLAPEYASSGKLTEKSDVFSFGVVLLELITGRRPVDATESYFEDSLVEWARPLLTRALEDGNLDALVDPRLQNNYDMDKMMRVVASAAACVRHSARRRPRMGQIVRALEGDAAISDLNKGVRPGHSTVYGSFGSSDYDSSQYSEDMKRFRKVALASQEYGSEYSGHTSEYGLNPSVSSSEYQQSKEIELSTGRSNHSRQTGNRKHHSGINGERFSEKEIETPPNMSSKFVNQ